jgi:transcriptional regulator with XRE-family HTH domain
MYVADRIRKLREAKQLSQGDLERRTGLLRCYISRVENGVTVPSIETLQKIMNALEMPFYQFFYDGQDTPPMPPDYLNGQKDWSTRREVREYMAKLMHALAWMTDRDRELLMDTAAHMASHSHRYRHRPGLTQADSPLAEAADAGICSSKRK